MVATIPAQLKKLWQRMHRTRSIGSKRGKPRERESFERWLRREDFYKILL